jgi:hypothetical protein
VLIRYKNGKTVETIKRLAQDLKQKVLASRQKDLIVGEIHLQNQSK